MLPLMEEEFVNQKKLLSKKQFSDVLVLTSSLPGVIAFNASLLIGLIVGRTKGAFFSVLGVLTPPIIIISFMAKHIATLNSNSLLAPAFIGMRAGICALILLVLIRLSKECLKNKRELAIAIIAFVAVRVFNISSITVIISCGLLGWLLFYRERLN